MILGNGGAVNFHFAFNLSTMIGQNFEIDLSQMAKIELKLSIMVRENFNFFFEIYMLQMAIIAFKLSTVDGNYFEIYVSQMAKIAFKLSTIVGQNFKILNFT